MRTVIDRCGGDVLSRLINSMSDDKKAKMSLSYRTVILILLILNVGDAFDIKNAIKVLKNIPYLMEQSEENGRDIKALRNEIENLKDILKRNKIGANALFDPETATTVSK